MTKGLLLIAVGYPVLLVALAIFLMRQDPQLVFDQYYMLGTLAIAPAFLLSLIVVMARREAGPSALLSAGVGVWVLIVTALHLWFISLMVQMI